jgi:hypothetical protein
MVPTLRIQEILEDATAGATTSANVAVVVNSTVANPNLKGYKKKGRKKNSPGDNGLDATDSLMGGPATQSIIKRPY